MKVRFGIALLGLVTITFVFVAIARVRAAKRTLYVAICTEAQEHGGQEIAVGPQRDTFEQANADGKAHESLYHGHRWRVGTN